MKPALRLLAVSLFALWLSAQAPDVSGTWLATGVPYEPWTVKLTQDGSRLTGTMEQNGRLRGQVAIYEGRIDGSAVSWKAKSPDGARAITFTGNVHGEEIALHRATEFITEESLGGTGLFGSDAAPEFTIRRARADSAGAGEGVEHWEAVEGVAFHPWTFDLRVRGGSITGAVGQAPQDPGSGTTTSLVGPFEIYDGKVNGADLEFKVKTLDGGRVITFRGVRNGNQIAFQRACQVVNGDPGLNGILGASGATAFTARLTAFTGTVALKPAGAPKPAPPPSPQGIAGRWQAAAVPNGPWTFELATAGASLTGTVRQGGAPSEPVGIAGGKVAGTTLSFNVLSPDGERIIAFQGRVNGDEISFVRRILPVQGGTRGGNDLYGGSAPLQFVAVRAAPSVPEKEFAPR